MVCHLWWYSRKQPTLHSWKAKCAVTCDVTGYYYYLLLHLIQVLGHLLNHYYSFKIQYQLLEFQNHCICHCCTI